MADLNEIVAEINMCYTVLSGNKTTLMIPNAAIFANPLQLKTMQQIAGKKELAS